MDINRYKSFFRLALSVIFISLFSLCFFYLKASIDGQSDDILEQLVLLSDSFETYNESIQKLIDGQNSFNESAVLHLESNESSLHSINDNLKRVSEKVAVVTDELNRIRDNSHSFEVGDSQRSVAEGIREQSLRDLEKNPRDREALLVLGKLMYEDGDLYSASKYLELAVAMEPFNLEALSLLGRLYRKEKNHEKALDIYRRLSDMEPENSAHHYYLAESLLLEGWRGQSFKTVKRALTLNDSSPSCLNLAGQIAMSLGLKREALDYFDRSLSLERDPEIFTVAGDLCRQMNQFSQSLVYWENAIDHSDRFTEEGVQFILDQYEKMARLSLEEEDLSRIDEYFRRSEEIGGNEALYYLYLQSLGRRTLTDRFVRELRHFEKRYPGSFYLTELVEIKTRIKEA